jgi:hypothetical protein
MKAIEKLSGLIKPYNYKKKLSGKSVFWHESIFIDYNFSIMLNQ